MEASAPVLVGGVVIPSPCVDAAEHGWGGVAEEEPDVYLAGLLLDSPGGEGGSGATSGAPEHDRRELVG